MSSRITTFSSSSRLTGMPSRVILFLAVLLPLVWGALDINFHGHFQCRTLKKVALAYIDQKSHLVPYVTADQKDFAGQEESGRVMCDCSQRDRKMVLTGKVTNDEIRQEFSDAVAAAVGTNQVDNQIEVCNIAALEELKLLLATPPTNMHLNYIVRDRCTIVLTGDLPDPAMKDAVGAMVLKVRGVRSVVNNLGMELEPARSIRLHNVYFDFNKWSIRPESQVVLDEVAQKIEDVLADSPQRTVRIEGHTDSIASNQYNKWLSEKRAQAVLEAFTSRGLPADKLRAVGKGESQLLVPNDDTPEKRAENRRIEIHFE